MAARGASIAFELTQQNIEYLIMAVSEPRPPESVRGRKKRCAKSLEPVFPSTPHVFDRVNNGKPVLGVSWVGSDGKEHSKTVTTNVGELDEEAADAKRMRIATELEAWYVNNV